MVPKLNEVVRLLQEDNFTGDIETSKDILNSHATDESIFYVEPEMVLFPRNTEDVKKIVRATTTTKEQYDLPLHLTARAAGTGLSGGSLNDSIIINTERYFNTIAGYKKNKEGIVYQVDPGVLYRDLEKLMNKHGVYIPSFPASKDICAIGGMVANNAAGLDTFYYGHTAEFVRSLEVVLSDGNTYTLKALEWKEFEKELKRDDLLGEIYRHIWELCLHNEEDILQARPKTKKNSAGYALWDVISTTTEEFMRGRGVFDATRLFSGSQGTLGIITQVHIQAVPRVSNAHLLAFPVYDIHHLGETIAKLMQHGCINIELFDEASFSAARDNPELLLQAAGNHSLLSIRYTLWKLYLLRFRTHIPKYIVLVTLPDGSKTSPQELVLDIQNTYKVRAWWVTNKRDEQVLWAIRRTSYTLSKMKDTHKRPAAFLEDVTIEPHKLPELISILQELFTKYKLTAYVHGHGGNGHLHFYPLMDFTNPQTARIIPIIAEEFFEKTTAIGGDICGEHNDGIIRTPYLDKMFSKNILQTFRKLEQVFDPQDIFNPGKKVNPRFSISQVIRHRN